jgi:hypothetical protein
MMVFPMTISMIWYLNYKRFDNITITKLPSYQITKSLSPSYNAE